MKLSNRDKKLLLILGILVVVAVPIAFVFRPYAEKCTEIKQEIETQTKRLEELEKYDKNRDQYLDDIKYMQDAEAAIIAKYDMGLEQTNIIKDIEVAEEDTPFVVDNIIFTPVEETVLRAATVDSEGNAVEGLNFATTSTLIEFNSTYEQLLKYLAALRDYEFTQYVVSLEAKYDDKTGRLANKLQLNQYAFIGAGRDYPAVSVPTMEYGTESIFGTYIEDEEINEAVNGPEEESEEAEE